MQFVLVCKLNNVSFEVAEKQLDKHIEGLKMTSYKTIHNRTTEIATYSNNDCSKVFDINIHYNKNTNTYNISIYELMESREIKVIKANGDCFYTRINGSDQDIINHYNENNYLNSDLDEQVRFIEYEHAKGKVIFNFEFNNNLSCYQY